MYSKPVTMLLRPEQLLCLYEARILERERYMILINHDQLEYILRREKAIPATYLITVFIDQVELELMQQHFLSGSPTDYSLILNKDQMKLMQLAGCLEREHHIRTH